MTSLMELSAPPYTKLDEREMNEEELEAVTAKNQGNVAEEPFANTPVPNVVPTANGVERTMENSPASPPDPGNGR